MHSTTLCAGQARLLSAGGPQPPSVLVRGRACWLGEKIGSSSYDPVTSRFRHLDRGLFKFLELCLQPDPGQRATAQELVANDFLRGLPDSLAGTLSAEAQKVQRLAQRDSEAGAVQHREASLRALADTLLAEGVDVSAALTAALLGGPTGGVEAAAPVQRRGSSDGVDRPASSRQVLRRDSPDKRRSGATPSTGPLGRPPQPRLSLDGRSSAEPCRELPGSWPSERQLQRRESLNGILGTGGAAAGGRQLLQRRESESGAPSSGLTGRNGALGGEGVGFSSGRHSWAGSDSGGAQSEGPMPRPPVSASMARLLAGAKVYGVPAVVSLESSPLRWQG